jgi:hypothetical protein
MFSFVSCWSNLSSSFVWWLSRDLDTIKARASNVRVNLRAEEAYDSPENPVLLD